MSNSQTFPDESLIVDVVKPWDHTPFKIWSLWDMLQKYGHLFVTVTERLVLLETMLTENLRDTVEGGPDIFTAAMIQTIAQIEEQIKGLDLPVTEQQCGYIRLWHMMCFPRTSSMPSKSYVAV